MQTELVQWNKERGQGDIVTKELYLISISFFCLIKIKINFEKTNVRNTEFTTTFKFHSFRTMFFIHLHNCTV